MGDIMGKIKVKIDEYLEGIIAKPEITKEEFELLMTVYDRHAAMEKYMDLFKVFDRPAEFGGSNSLSIGVTTPEEGASER